LILVSNPANKKKKSQNFPEKKEKPSRPQVIHTTKGNEQTSLTVASFDCDLITLWDGVHREKKKKLKKNPASFF